MTVNFNAHAELFRNTQSVDAPPLKKPYTLRMLVEYVIAKRPPDQQVYSIMVGDKIYNAQQINGLYESEKEP